MQIRFRNILMAVGFLGILIPRGAMNLRAETIELSPSNEEIVALLAGDCDLALARFREILESPTRDDSISVEQAHLGLLMVQHRRGDFPAFRDELEVLINRNPESSVLDDALLLYATFSYQQGQYRLAGELCDLFASDVRFADSPCGEQMDQLALLAHRRAGNAALFRMAHERFRTRYPNSASQASAELLSANVALDVERHRDTAIGLFRRFLEEHPESTLVPNARMDLARAYSQVHAWRAMFSELENVAEGRSGDHPRHAARAIVEMGLWRLALSGPEGGRARDLFTRASSEFPDTPGGDDAARWLVALRDFNSLENMELQWALASRCWDVAGDRVRGTQTYRRLVMASRGLEFEESSSAPGLSEDQRAEWLHRLCLADLYTGHRREAWERAERIMRNFPQTIHARIHAPSVIAMCLLKNNRYEEARERYWDIANRLRVDDTQAGYVHRQIATISTLLGDPSGEALAWFHLLEGFPDDEMVPWGRARLDQLIRQDPQVLAMAEETFLNSTSWTISGSSPQVVPINTLPPWLESWFAESASDIPLRDSLRGLPSLTDAGSSGGVHTGLISDGEEGLVR